MLPVERVPPAEAECCKIVVGVQLVLSDDKGLCETTRRYGAIMMNDYYTNTETEYLMLSVCRLGMLWYGMLWMI